MGDDDEAELKPKVVGAKKAVNRKLLDYMKLFAKFVNPKSLYKHERMSELYMEMLGKTDKDVQVGHVWPVVT